MTLEEHLLKTDRAVVDLKLRLDFLEAAVLARLERLEGKVKQK